MSKRNATQWLGWLGILGGQRRPAGLARLGLFDVTCQPFSDKSYCSSRLPVIALSFYSFYVEVK